MSPQFGGKTVTHEEYLYLDAANNHLAPPSGAMVEHARHLDTGCIVCADDAEGYARRADELAKLESLRGIYAVGILQITQALEAWSHAEERIARGQAAMEPPMRSERLKLAEKALRSLSAKGARVWKK